MSSEKSCDTSTSVDYDSLDYETITARQRETWATGDFHQIARLNVPMAEARMTMP